MCESTICGVLILGVGVGLLRGLEVMFGECGIEYLFQSRIPRYDVSIERTVFGMSVCLKWRK